MNIDVRKKELKKRYSDLAASYNANRYGSEIGKFYLQQTDRMFTQALHHVGLSDISTLKILDVATGTGRNIFLLCKMGCKQVVGLDCVMEMLQKAATECSIDSAFNLVRGDAENLPFQNGKFDLVCASRFFHLIPRQMQMSCLHEFARVLKPNGMIVVEFVNPLYFLNIKTFLKTGYKFIASEKCRALTTFPLFWKKKYPFLHLQALVGTWFSGVRFWTSWFPSAQKFFDRLLLHYPFNLLSERVLTIFTLVQHPHGQSTKMLFPSKTHITTIGPNVSIDEKMLIKKPRNFGLRNCVQFLKDKKILAQLQNTPTKYFQVPILKKREVFRYATKYENAIPIKSLSEISDLTDPKSLLFFSALKEFQSIMSNLPILWIERIDACLSRLLFFKKLMRITVEHFISFRQSVRILRLYLGFAKTLTKKMCGSAHGDLLSGGNLSLLPEQPKYLFLDFENVRRREFFLYDLVYMCCKRPIVFLFNETFVGEMLSWYSAQNPYLGKEVSKQDFEVQLRFCFIQILVRRLHTSARNAQDEKIEIGVGKQNLLFCLSDNDFKHWFQQYFSSFFQSRTR